MGRSYLDRVRDMKFFKQRLDRGNRPGSNQWAVSGRHTANGLPLVANDPHLALDAPSTFYPIHLSAGAVDVMGSGFAGVPFVIVGQTRNFAWGATVSHLDVTDIYQEQVVQDPTSPSGLATVYMGVNEPIIPIPEVYRANRPGDGVPDNLVVVPPGGGIPPVTLIVPRRNNGPIVQLDLATGSRSACSTPAFPARARSMRSGPGTMRATSRISGAACNGSTPARRTSPTPMSRATSPISPPAEVPVREDLQAGTVAGAPPWFIRNGRAATSGCRCASTARAGDPLRDPAC